MASSTAIYPVGVEKWAVWSKCSSAVFLSVQSGALVRPSCCSICGGNNNGEVIQGHHDDYTKPLEVRWVCMECHRDIHFPNRDKSKINKVETPLHPLRIYTCLGCKSERASRLRNPSRCSKCGSIYWKTKPKKKKAKES